MTTLHLYLHRSPKTSRRQTRTTDCGCGCGGKCRDSKPAAAGVLYQDENGFILLGKRQGADHEGEWAFPGGKVERKDRDPAEAAMREFSEETGHSLTAVRTLGEAEGFHAFTTRGKRFEPKIDREHSEFGWFKRESLPSPMHPVAAQLIGKATFDTCKCGGKHV